MRVYRSLAELPPDFGPSAVTIGNFDGVHRGHCEILRRVKALADARGWKPSVLTFDPHPTKVVAPERTPKLMTTPERRAELMAGGRRGADSDSSLRPRHCAVVARRIRPATIGRSAWARAPCWWATTSVSAAARRAIRERWKRSAAN